MSQMNLFARTVSFAQAALTLSASGLALCFAIVVTPAEAQDAQPSGPADVPPIGISAENTVIETDTAVYTIKKIELSGTRLSNAALSALLDSKANMTLTDRLAKLSASTVSIPELTVATKSKPVQTVVYQNIKLTDVQNGKAAEADIETSHFFVTREEGDRIEGTYGHIHAQGIDLVLAAHVISATREDETEALKPLYQTFSMDGFKLNVVGKELFTMSIGKMSGRNVMARAFAMHPSDYQTATGDRTQLAALMKDYFSSIQIEELIANDMEILSKTDGNTPLRMYLGKMSISKFGNAKIDDVDFGSFSMKVEDTSVKIDDIDFKTIDFQKLREPLVKGTLKGGDVYELNGGESAGDETQQQAAILVPTVAQFIVTKVDVSFRDDEREPTASKPSFSIDRFEIDGAQPFEARPTQVTASLDHFTLNPKFLKESSLKPLIDMGYPKLDLSSRVDMAWDMSSEELAVKDISINGVDMGSVKVSGVIDNLSKDFFSGDSTAMQAAAFGALIKKIEIRIDNNGLFDRAMMLEAKEQKKSIVEIKQSYVAAAAIGIPAMLNNKPAAKTIGAAVAKFIANPKSIHIVASSADGLGAADFALMADPTTLLDSLDIKATADEPSK